MDAKEFQVNQHRLHLTNQLKRVTIVRTDDTVFIARRGPTPPRKNFGYECVACGAELQPGRAGRKCADCRSK